MKIYLIVARLYLRIVLPALLTLLSWHAAWHRDLLAAFYYGVLSGIATAIAMPSAVHDVKA